MKKIQVSDTGRFTIVGRIIALTAIFTILITGTILLQSVLSLSRQINQTNLQSTEYRLRTAAMSVEYRVKEIDHLLDWCSVNPSARAFLFSNIHNPTLSNNIYTSISAQYSALSSSSYIQRFLLAGSNGRIMMFGSGVAQSNIITPDAAQLLPGASPEQPDFAWEEIVDDPLMLPTARVSGIPISRKLSDSGRDALLYLSVSPALITDILKNFRLEEGTQLFWHMGENDYKVLNGQLELQKDLPELKPDTGNTLSSNTALYKAEFARGPYYVIVCPLDSSHDLALAACIPAQTITDQLPQMQPTLLSILMLVAPLGILLGLLLRNIVDRPIRSLHSQIEKISNGDFTPNPGIEWNHELGDVGRGINRMSQNIAGLMDAKLEDQKQKQDLEYQMLQGQVSPHFLYNALNSIQWMATIQRASGIVEMTSSLSRLLKSISKSKERLIPLEQELHLLEDYFTIQKYRYGGTITMEILWNTPKEICQTISIPRFTLQPLAENAIFHGIEPKGSAGKLTLTIQRNGNNLLLLLQDDGVGMTPEQIQAVFNSPEDSTSNFRHIGVQNVHKRLMYHFGPEYGLHIESQVDIGTTISIRIPFSQEQEETI